MKEETMMKILDSPQSYTAHERLAAARRAIILLDYLATVEEQSNQQIQLTQGGTALSKGSRHVLPLGSLSNR